MELFEKIKSLLFNPKEEWTIIEAENAPHTSVLTNYLLIIALIPTLFFFAGKYLEYRINYNKYIDAGIERIENSYSNRGSSNNMERNAEIEMAKSKAVAEFEGKAEEMFQTAYPFRNIKWSVIFAACLFGIIVGGVYISAAIINTFSNQFGGEKDFNRTFSLVAYSYTPICIAGILYILGSFNTFIPYIGLYGLYLLYLGIDSQLKLTVEKKTTSFVFTLIVLVGVWAGLAKGIVPEIQKKVMTEEYINIMKENYKGDDIFMIDARMRKSIEQKMESELENHKY